MSLFKTEDFLELRGPGQGGPFDDVYVKISPMIACLLAAQANAKCDTEIERLQAAATYWMKKAGELEVDLARVVNVPRGTPDDCVKSDSEGK